ncbi:MAG TPA: rhomboid family intramembrane serine protease [Chthoniobacterales bacterium]|nr:rhomboid family intramembrane serine protease [Chthoniobacterales bacterium]
MSFIRLLVDLAQCRSWGIARVTNFCRFTRFSKIFLPEERHRLAPRNSRLFIRRMFGVTTSDDYRPVAWMGRYPLDVTTMLVALHVVCAIIAALFGGYGLFGYAMFDSAYIWSGQLWRFITYAFIHPAGSSALLWFAVEMYMLFIFGREVERFFGRRAYLALYGLLLLLPPIVLTLWGLTQRTGMTGSATLHFGVFIAFVILYPNVQFFAFISAKWVAVILAAIGTLSALAARDWQYLVILWTSIGAAFLFVQLHGAGPELVWWERVKGMIRPRPKLHVVPKPTTRPPAERDDVYASIDPILDKISKSGIGSLTAQERRQLDRARNRLLNEPK